MKNYLLRQVVGLSIFDHRNCGMYGAMFGANLLGSMASNLPSLAGGIAQSGVNFKAQKNANETNIALNERTNETNKQIADDVNATQLQIHQDDMNFNAQQAQIQREWDSIQQQRQRLIDAGYNPLMVGNGAFGSSGSAASAPAAPSLDVATLNPSSVRPVEFDGLEAIGKAMGLFEKAEDIKSKRIENDIKPEMFASELEYRNALIKNVGEQTKILQENLKWLPKQNLMRWRLERIQNRIFKQQLKEMQDTFEYRKKQLEWLPKISEKQWEQFDQNITNMKKQVEQLDKEMLVMEAQRNKLLAETQTINDLRDDQIAMLREQILATRIRSALPVLDIPVAFRDQFFKCLEGLHFDTSGFQHLDQTKWYREPNDWVRALMYAIGLFKGQIKLDDVIDQFATSTTSQP